MGYSKDIYEKSIAILERKRAIATREAEERKMAFFLQCPPAEKIEQNLSSTAVRAAKAVLNGGNTKAELACLKKRSLELQQEEEQLLNQYGYQKNHLAVQYDCNACSDQGYIDGKMCACLKQLLRIEACKKLNNATPLSECSFENFSLSFYPECEDANGMNAQKQMSQILQYLSQYQEAFGTASQSLLLQGGTGLGKTHLSLAIAHKAIEKGFGVIYGSAQNIVTSLEKERFNRDSNVEDTNQLLLDCDLLIVDDLGTEFTTSFVTAAIYSIINTRLMMNKPTIISTNLSMREMNERYTERFASRVIGSYKRLFFCGKDIRQQKALR